MIFSTQKSLTQKKISRNRVRKQFADHLKAAFWLKSLKHFISRTFIRLKIQGDRLSIKTSGFTLIELLVSMLIAGIIISTLLAFTINIMEQDRREQAKVESQGEVQAALNYISDDLQEAIYIYNSDGLTKLTTDTAAVPANPSAVPPTAAIPAIPAPLPSFANSTPILVFWKRYYYAPSDSVSVVSGGGGSTTKRVGCLPYGTSTTEDATNCLDANGNVKGSGQYTYSLVAYYLIYDGDTTWSNAARIGRWELKDGIRSVCQSSTCSAPQPIETYDVSTLPGATPSYVYYWSSPDRGFSPFSLQGGNVDSLMTSWRKSFNYAYTNSLVTLVDFIDDTPYQSLQDNGIPGDSSDQVDIAIRPNATVAGNTTNNDCFDAGYGVGGTSNAATQQIPSALTQRIPSAFSTLSSNAAKNLSSFYVCVNSTQTVARVYLRGNALARLNPNQTQSQRGLSASTKTFLSTGNIRAYGRGLVFTQ